jgi:hypothetical protein
VAVPVKDAEVDTDSEGDELTMQEALENLRKLAVAPSHSNEFYAQLHQCLTAMAGLQYLDETHAATRNCVALADHVAQGLTRERTRGLVCRSFCLLVKNRFFVHRLLESNFAMRQLVVGIEQEERDEVRAALLLAVKQLSLSRGTRNELLRCECMEVMLGLMGSPAVGDACKAHIVFTLRRMCKTTQARELLARLCGVAPLVSYFFDLTVQPVQKSLAGLLQTLATNPEIKSQLAELGAVPRLVGLLTMSQMHMLKYIICIVRNVACNHDENRLLIARAGGIRALLTLLPQVSIKLQQKIAGALQNLATNRDNRLQIAQLGGVSVLIQLIKTPDQKLQKYGLGGLKRLVYSSREATLAFQKEGGLVPLMALLDSDDASVLKNAVHALNRVRHYIGREPIEVLGGITSMCRLLTCRHEKIRLLVRRTLQSMDEDLGSWIHRIQLAAIRILVAARVLLNPHHLVMMNESGPAAGAAQSGVEPIRRRISVSTLRISLRAPRARSGDLPASMSPGSPSPPPASPISPVLAGLRGMTPETNAVLTSLGFGETYWHLRPGTRHMLPIPLLQLILGHLDEDNLLSKSQKREICAWARDRSSLGKPIEEFLAVITNNALVMSEAPGAETKKPGCIIC